MIVKALEKTAQEVLDHVSEHLMKQGVPSMSKGDSHCVYRSDRGLSCAVGGLLTDEEYEHIIISLGEVGNKRGWNYTKDLFENGLKHSALIQSLQVCHDGYAKFNSTQTPFPEFVYYKLADTAFLFNLDTKHLALMYKRYHKE